MTIKTNEKIYCDANFFVAYGAKQLTDPDRKKKALILFAELLANGCVLTASPLTFDEAWKAIRDEAGVKPNGSRFSFVEIAPTLRTFTEELLSRDKFEIVQFPVGEEGSGVQQALDNLENFGLKPRDSFHLATMQKNQIQHIITRDGHDFGAKAKDIGITVLNF
jgi:predicted nucleic acid-binding protein